MFKKIAAKLFCLHQWTSHAKNDKAKSFNNGAGMDVVREILICSVCGKIKTIEY